MRAWELLKLALEGVRRTPLRVTLTSIGVAVATGALVSMLAFAEGLQSQARKPFEELDLLSRIEVSPKDEGPEIDDAAVKSFAEIPGVEIAYPEISRLGIEIRVGEKSEVSFASALPRKAAGLPWASRLVTSGRFFSPGDEIEVLVGGELAKSLGFDDPEKAVGAKATIGAAGLVPSLPVGFRFERKEIEATIVGVWTAPGILMRGAERAILLPEDVIRSLPGAETEGMLSRMRGREKPSAPGGGFPSAMVRAKDPLDVPAIETALKEKGFDTYATASRLDSMKTFFVVLDVLLGAVGTVALVVAGLGIVNTLLMSVLERTKEIGTWKAIGASDGDVRLLFLAEAGIVGLLGGIGGLVLGRGVAAAIGVGIGAYARSKGVTHDVAVFAFPGWLLLGAVGFAVAASMISGVYPASRAAKVDPIRALRGE